MNISITLVHDKTLKENEAQIEKIKSLLVKNTVLNDEYDEEGNVIGQFETYYFTLSGLSIPHEVIVLQIIPFNSNVSYTFSTRQREVNGEMITEDTNNYEQELRKGGFLPSNLYSLECPSRVVIYCPSTDSKLDGRPFVANHPRFFNWGLKRGTDLGADLNIYLEDIKKFVVDDLAFQLNSLIDPDDKHEYVEDESVKIATLKLLAEVGQLNESKGKAQAVDDLKERLQGKDMKVG